MVAASLSDLSPSVRVAADHEDGKQARRFMTALTEYQRLEAPGLWRSAPGAQRRDVIVSVGEASLVITDMADRALAHWSLPAVQRMNPDSLPALYAPGDDATEDLEIEDPTMIGAIEKVRAVVARRRPQPGRLRQSLLIGLLLAFALGAVVWLPGALVRHTASVVPNSQRELIGTALLARIQQATGAPCDAPQGTRALAHLRERLLGPEIRRLVVAPHSVHQTAHLPGGIILLNRRLLVGFDTPEVAAGYILAEAERAAAEDPLLRLLREAGPVTAFRLLTTGEVSAPTLAAHADRLLAADPAPVPPEALLARFAERRVAVGPYALARDLAGDNVEALLASDMSGEPVLSDGEWIALQGICGE